MWEIKQRVLWSVIRYTMETAHRRSSTSSNTRFYLSSFSLHLFPWRISRDWQRNERDVWSLCRSDLPRARLVFIILFRWHRRRRQRRSPQPPSRARSWRPTLQSIPYRHAIRHHDEPSHAHQRSGAGHCRVLRVDLSLLRDPSKSLPRHCLRIDHYLNSLFYDTCCDLRIADVIFVASYSRIPSKVGLPACRIHGNV